MKKSYQIIAMVTLSCIVMALVDGWLQPGYMSKSFIKVVMFLGLPWVYCEINSSSKLKNTLRLNSQTFKQEMLLGIFVYVLIVGGYLCLKDFFDFSSVTQSLNQTTGVNPSNFIGVALYISLMNSWLEELFFRGFAYLALSHVISNKFAMHYSALIFALYHIAMMIGWFDVWMIVLAIIGLYIGGLLFNILDQKSQTIYPSWTVHIAANLAINTVGFMLFKIL